MEFMPRRSANWMASLLPYSIAIGPIGTLTTLEIKQGLGGTGVQVGQAMSAGTAASIVASLLWGQAVDRFDRKGVLLVGLVGVAAFTLLLGMAGSVTAVIAYYAAVSFFSTAVGIATSVLIMDTVDKRLWNSSYSRLNYLMSLGYLGGDVGSSVAAADMPIRSIMALLSIVGSTSVALALLSVPRSVITFERLSLLHVVEGFITRLRLAPAFFLRPPSPSTFKPLRLLRLWGTPAAQMPMLYVAASVFFVASGIFNTLYPYGLSVEGLSNYQVLVVMAAGMAAQVAGFMMAPRAIERLGGNARASVLWLSVRGLSYITIGLSTALVGGSAVAMATGLSFYPLAAGIAYANFYTALNVMVFEVLKGSREGRGLGLYSTLTGLANMAGSLASGYIAETLGIGLTYVVAGLLLGAAAYIFYELSRFWI